MKRIYILAGLAAAMLLLAACNNSAQPTATPGVGGAVAIAEVYCSTSNETAKAAYNEALALEEQGNLAEAERLYRQAIELDAGYCDAMDNLGLLLRQQGKVEEAISWYQQSLLLMPDNSVALLNLATSYHIQGDVDQAEATFEKLIEVAPDNPEGYFGLGSIFISLQQYGQAVPYLEKAEQLYGEVNSPWILDAQYLLCSAHFMLQDYPTAKAYAEAIYDHYDEDGPINYILGMGYLMEASPDMKTAREYILKAQELGVDVPNEVLTAIEGD